MLRIAVLSLLLAMPVNVAAQDDISARIGADGLASSEATLSALAEPTANQRFALGGIRFLRAIERALQTRYRYGMSGETMGLPVLRLNVPPNPAPEPFDPAVVEQIFADVIADMARARTTLDSLGPDDEVGLRVALADLWFDVNGSGTREPAEGLVVLAGTTLLPRRFQDGEANAPVIRFDTADVAWLKAYTHFLSGIGDLILAFPSRDVIEQVLAAAQDMRSFIDYSTPDAAYEYLFSSEVDAAMIVYLALQQQPDAARTRAARLHFLDMIRENRIFWALLDQETDNDAEWIPNARQTSALGIRMAPNTGTVWQAVLADAEDLLEGRKLIPHWRYGRAAGINLKRLLDDPIPVRPAEWLQGMGLLAYAETGERVGFFNWQQFTRMVRGDSMLFVMLLN